MSIGNHILDALLPAESQRLRQHAERVALRKGNVLLQHGDVIEHVLFPTGGLVSLLAITANDEALDLAMVGADGLIGLPIVLGQTIMLYHAMVQVSGTALRVRAHVLRGELERSHALRAALLHAEHDVNRQISRSVVCHRYHSLAQRVARWLLAASDRVGRDTFELTQEGLAYVIGSARTAITGVAVGLQEDGLIQVPTRQADDYQSVETRGEGMRLLRGRGARA